MGFYNELTAATEGERAGLFTIPLIQAGVAGQVSLESYVAFLTEAYHHVKHTVPLLMGCGARLPERLEWLRAATGHYIQEETGHHEWILDDINACGADGEAVRRSAPSLATELMVAYACDTVNRLNPVGFFGMVLVLEGTSVEFATRAAGAIRQTLDLPDSAFSYLTSHGSLDISHVDYFAQLMDRLEEEEDKRAVVHCAKVMYRLYGDIFRSIPTENVHGN